MFTISESLEKCDDIILLVYIVQVREDTRRCVIATYDANECDYELMLKQVNKPVIYESYSAFDNKGWDATAQKKIDKCLLDMDYEDDNF